MLRIAIKDTGRKEIKKKQSSRYSEEIEKKKKRIQGIAAKPKEKKKKTKGYLCLQWERRLVEIL